MSERASTPTSSLPSRSLATRASASIHRFWSTYMSADGSVTAGFATTHHAHDPVGHTLKWTLLAVAIITFAMLGWATKLTYRGAPPIPAHIVGADSTVLIAGPDIVAGKAGFQKADLMDYGSLYGMGSYFGEDYTASNLVRLADLSPEDQASIKAMMQTELQAIDLTHDEVRVPAAVAQAIPQLRAEIVASLLKHDFARGWTKAYSLDPTTAAQTAD